MEIGITLKIQIEGTKSRLTSELIGVEKGEYLVIKMPPVQFMDNLSNVLYKGNSIIVRYIHKGIVYGFKSHISHFITNPAKLIFIEYPNRIESHELRAHKRLDCYLPANVKITDSTRDGTITDISREGYHIVIEKAKVANSLLLQVDNEIGVSFQLPGVAEKLTVEGRQKNIKQDNDNVGIGAEFSNMNHEVQDRLYNFLATAGA
jgi:hypothetical protein